MGSRVRMVLVMVQLPKGVLHVLFGGNFTEAKEWARAHFGDRPVRFKQNGWKAPQDCEYWLEKDRGRALGLPEVKGPVAMQFIAETLL